jgi:uncharacterized protein (TIGR03067 family)
MLRVLITVTTGFLMSADAPSGDAAKKDLDKLQGNWLMQSSERDGTKLTDNQVKEFSRTIKGNFYTVTIENEQGVQDLTGTYTLDPGKTPKTIDAMLTNGPMKGKTMLGIYKLDGDTQTVCFAPVGQNRPTSFDSKQGTLSVWKREKVKPDKEVSSAKRDAQALACLLTMSTREEDRDAPRHHCGHRLDTD